ncbi:26S protease regulatory subunit 4 [Phellopilus nigrolimitatus]|nr:26S protease regulatory subunit 4 [Phellopilus nigrolimitatus]
MDLTHVSTRQLAGSVLDSHTNWHVEYLKLSTADVQRMEEAGESTQLYGYKFERPLRVLAAQTFPALHHIQLATSKHKKLFHVSFFSPSLLVLQHPELVHDERNEEDCTKADDLCGAIGTLEEIIDDDLEIIWTSSSPEFYTQAIVGVLQNDTDPMVGAMKLDKAPTESYTNVGGLDQQIQETKEAVELPLTYPELYEEMGIRPPRGVILYGVPETGKTLLVKAVASQTSGTFLRVVGSELIQKDLGDGPKLVRELFRVAEEHAPSIMFIDEIDAIGTRRYESTFGGEREIQHTMLELLNQLDGVDRRGDVKIITAMNRIESLDPVLICPGRIDRKIEFKFLLPDVKTKRHIFELHTSWMSLSEDVRPWVHHAISPLHPTGLKQLPFLRIFSKL